MPITAPILDDRSYQQLRDELVRRIPVFGPEWTDHNPGDPGITLIELFSFLGENLLYRFNQIPDATKLAFLSLLRIPLRPAVAAHAVIAIVPDSPLGDGVLIPQFSQAKAGDLPFETLTEVTAWPVTVTAVGRVSVPDPSADAEAAEFVLRSIDALGGLQGATPAYYENGIVSTDGSTPSVDFQKAVDGMLWVAVLKTKTTDVTKLGGATLNLAFVPDGAPPTLDQVTSCPGAGTTSTGPAVDWQISTGKLANDGTPLYQALDLAGDTTRGLSQQGIVRLELPAESTGFGVFPASDPDLRGTGDRPPLLDDNTEANILFWMRAFRRDKSRFALVRLMVGNATDVSQQQAGGPEYLGTGTAQPDQTYSLVNRPVIDGTLTVEVEEAGGWLAWTQVPGFWASKPDDRHYVVDLQAGTVTFGNGIQGMPPPIGQRIRAVTYRWGGTAAGNVAPNAISKLTNFSNAKSGNPLAAYGGADGETIEDALDRIPGELRRRDRAVTAGDFQELALATPGALVGRAECLPRFYPPERASNRAGVVSVVVWPTEDKVNPNAPLPDRNLLRSVCAYLDARRLVTTELYVIPPTYRKVAVAIGLTVKPGYGVDGVRRWVELAVRQYLAPLPPYGPTGGGWPLGRRVYGPELEAAALQVEGVEFLDSLKVAGQDDHQNWVQGTVNLNLWEVPELSSITVVDGPLTFDPPQAIVPPPPDGPPIPIPVIREVC